MLLFITEWGQLIKENHCATMADGIQGGTRLLPSLSTSPPPLPALAQRPPPPPLRVQAPRRHMPGEVVPRRQCLAQRYRRAADALGLAVVVDKVLERLDRAGTATPPRLDLQDEKIRVKV